MKFHAPTKQMTIEVKDLEYAAICLINAIRNIRDLAELPHDKYEQHGALTKPDFAQKSILDAAKTIGIDLGAEWGHELDVRK